MNDIVWIYVIDNTGAPIFSHENYLEGSKNTENALMSHFIYGLQIIASQIDYNELRRIEIAQENYFLMKDNHINFKYILKLSKNAKHDQIKSLMNILINLFQKKFENKLNLSIKMKSKILSEIREEIIRILSMKSQI